jgi:hypothetical protein
MKPQRDSVQGDPEAAMATAQQQAGPLMKSYVEQTASKMPH